MKLRTNDLYLAAAAGVEIRSGQAPDRCAAAFETILVVGTETAHFRRAFAGHDLAAEKRFGIVADRSLDGGHDRKAVETDRSSRIAPANVQFVLGNIQFPYDDR